MAVVPFFNSTYYRLSIDFIGVSFKGSRGSTFLLGFNIHTQSNGGIDITHILKLYKLQKNGTTPTTLLPLKT